MQWLRAVVPDAYRDAAIVQELPNVVRVDPDYVETRQSNPGLSGCRTEDGHSWDFGEPIHEKLPK